MVPKGSTKNLFEKVWIWTALNTYPSACWTDDHEHQFLTLVAEVWHVGTA